MSNYGSSKGPWIFSVLVIAGSAAFGYYLSEELSETRQELLETKTELRSHRSKANAELVRTKKKAAEEKAVLLQKEQEAKLMAERLKEALGEASGGLFSKDGKLTLELVDKVLFRFGEADLTENGMRVLSKVGDALKEFPDNQIWIQGHTDDVPVAKDNENFKSNWELSAARAVNVVHYLQDEAGVDPSRLAAVAFSEYRPVSKNNKKRNRRIEIVLAPADVAISRKK